MKFSVSRAPAQSSLYIHNKYFKYRAWRTKMIAVEVARGSGAATSLLNDGACLGRVLRLRVAINVRRPISLGRLWTPLWCLCEHQRSRRCSSWAIPHASATSSPNNATTAPARALFAASRFFEHLAPAQGACASVDALVGAVPRFLIPPAPKNTATAPAGAVFRLSAP